MAMLGSKGTGGDFTAAGTWGLCSAAAELDSVAGAEALTVAEQSSGTFILGAVAHDAIYVRVASRAAGSPTNTMTVTLRNSTSGTDVASVTINVSDLPVVVTADQNGPWICLKLGSTHTPNGTDSYLIKANISATTTAVSLFRNASADNFSRQVRTTTTQAPAATDRMIIAPEFTTTSTPSATTVTMNNGASTTFGTAGDLVNEGIGSLYIGNSATLAFGTTAATAYLLRMAGNLVVSSGGTLTLGTLGTPMPRDSSGILEFVITSDGDAGIFASNGSNVQGHGQSRTSGKDFWFTTLSADEAVAQTVISVNDDTGWLSGDEVGFAPTSRTRTESEQRTLANAAGASSIEITAGLTAAKAGSATDHVRGEIVLLTRNVKIRSTQTTLHSYVYIAPTATVNFQWTEFSELGFSTGDRRAILIQTTTGSCTFNKCAFRDFAAGCIVTVGAATNNFHLTNNVCYRTAGTIAWITVALTSGTSWTVSGNIVAANASLIGIDLNDIGGTVENNRVAGCGSASNPGISINDDTQFTSVMFNGNICHSNAGEGLGIEVMNLRGATLGAFTAWRNAGSGSLIATGTQTQTMLDVIWNDYIAFGNVNDGIRFTGTSGPFLGWIMRNAIIAGDTSFAQARGYGAGTAGHVLHQIRWENCIFGGGGGTKTTHGTADFNPTVGTLEQHSLWDCSLLSATRILMTNTLPDSYIKETRREGTDGLHSMFRQMRGTLATEQTTVHDAAPSEKMTPAVTAPYTLLSSPKRCAVEDTETVTFSVWVRKDGTYNGAMAPRLVLKRNPAAGIDADVVLDSLSVGADTWEELTGTSAAVTDDAVLEAYVEINGTAGNVFVDDWSVS